MKRLLTAVITFVLVAGSIPAAGDFIETVQTEDASVLDEATIVRDAHGVPHVYADTEEALWYANGYAQAHDRLWAMDLLRHLSFGEGASVVGPGGGILEMDLNARQNLYTEDELQAMYDDPGIDDGFRETVEAFTDGVNRAAAEMQASGEMPAEFGALQHAFEPWEALDTAAVASFLLAEFGVSGGAEVSNAQLLGTLNERLGQADGWDAFADHAWFTHDEAYGTIPGEYVPPEDPQGEPKQTFNDVPQDQRHATLAAKDAQSFGMDGDAVLPTFGFFQGESIDFRLGSNALLVSPDLSATGQALMGGGPQMGYFVPQVPYEIGLHGPQTEAEGIGVTGAPGVIIGTMENFSATVTSGISDQIDKVALPADGERSYTWDEDDVRDLDCRTEEHTLFTPPALYDPATGDPPVNLVHQEVCMSHVGPITHITYDEDGNPAWFFAEQSASRAQELRSAVSWLTVSQREDAGDFQAMFEDFSFTFNFHYAGLDSDGDENICYFHVGKQPIRNTALDPRLPTPAGDEWKWQGSLTGDELPWDCDPSTGYYANWNNKPQAGWASGDARELWGSMHRVERLDMTMEQALEANNDKLDLDAVKGILEDAATHSQLAHGIVPLILSNAPDWVEDGAIRALETWKAEDYSWEVDEGGNYHPGMTVFEDVTEELLHLVFDDELGDHVRDVTWDPMDSSDPHAGDHGRHGNKFAVLRDVLQGQTNQPWCENIDIPRADSCELLIGKAFSNTDLNVTSIGEVPLTPQYESPFTSLGLGPAYTIPMTNRATYYHFHVGSDTSQSFATLPPGASGHVNAADTAMLLGMGVEPAHMGDQLALYEGFEFKDVPWTQSEAEQGASDVTLLIVP